MHDTHWTSSDGTSSDGGNILLTEGQCLDQKTFHALYQQSPEGFRAELIGGKVAGPSPESEPHVRYRVMFEDWLSAYSQMTPNTLRSGGSILLGDKSEPQPDTCLVIEQGGQTTIEPQTEGGQPYRKGSPELVVEVSATTQLTDLAGGKKYLDYERYAVAEYIVVDVKKKQVCWFARRDDGFQQLKEGTDGILRSEVFPGLWLDPHAMIEKDWARVKSVLNAGVERDEHQGFCEELQRLMDDPEGRTGTTRADE